MNRYLTITMDNDWKTALRGAVQRAKATTYQGEVLNFESAGQFFGRLTEKRWDIVHLLQGQGELPVREVARQLSRDVKRVHEDIVTLADLGLVERTEQGGVTCPFDSVHIDMHLKAA